MADEPSQEPDETAPEAEDDAAEFGDGAEEQGDAEEGPPPGGTVEELLHEAEADRRRANASMSLVHKEHFALLGANCLFFAGALAAWRLPEYGQNNAGAALTHGLETIRGTAIFALSIYSFWVTGIGLYTKRTVVWPFLLNMLLGLWVGLGGVIRGFGSPEWDKALEILKKSDYTALDKMLAGISTIPPGYWMLAGGSLLVLFIVLKGIVGGAAKAKSAQGTAEGGGGERRRSR